MTKKFQRKIEDFICGHCGAANQGNGYTNHCSQCLWSKHVDINPGDRLAECQGLMKPVDLEQKAGEYVVIQECIRCGFRRKNRVAETDNFEAVVAITRR